MIMDFEVIHFEPEKWKEKMVQDFWRSVHMMRAKFHENKFMIITTCELNRLIQNIFNIQNKAFLRGCMC